MNFSASSKNTEICVIVIQIIEFHHTQYNMHRERCKVEHCHQVAEFTCNDCIGILCRNHLLDHFTHSHQSLISNSGRHLILVDYENFFQELQNKIEKCYQDALDEVKEISEIGRRLIENASNIKECLSKYFNGPTHESLNNIYDKTLNGNIRSNSARSLILCDFAKEANLKLLQIIEQIQKESNTNMQPRELLDTKDYCSNSKSFSPAEFEYYKIFSKDKLTETIVAGIFETLILIANYKKDIEPAAVILARLLNSSENIKNTLEDMIYPDLKNPKIHYFLVQITEKLKTVVRGAPEASMLRKLSEVLDIEISIRDDKSLNTINFHRKSCFLRLFLVKKEDYWMILIPKKSVYSSLVWKEETKHSIPNCEAPISKTLPRKSSKDKRK